MPKGIFVKLLVRFIIFSLISTNVFAASIIRDAEIENIIRTISNPIFKAAGLSPESINIYIVNDNDINAYVAGGSNIFINTGLLGLSESPDILIGVIAHETGHIAGGHLLRNTEEFKNTSITTALGYMVGLAAAAAGSPQAGVAIASGAGHVAQRQFLKHTRGHEEAADQAALSYLDKINLSAEGLLELLEKLYSRETTLYGDMNPYTLTHPLSRQRISHVKNYIEKSKYSNNKLPAETIEEYRRSIVKLNAFLSKADKTLKKYPKTDQSISAHYARSIAYYTIPDIDKALDEINHLIEKEPKNPFFNELKGQILFENGHVMDSIPFYERAVELLPKSPLLKIILATAYISSEKDELRQKAVNNLEQAIVQEKKNTFAWRQLAIAYGRGGDYGMSNLALAEEALLTGHKKAAKKFVEKAKETIKEGTPAYLRISDIMASLEDD